MTDPKNVRPVVGAALAVERLLAARPGWTAAMDAAEAIDALLLEADRHWRDRYGQHLRENDKICAELRAERERNAPRRPSATQPATAPQ